MTHATPDGPRATFAAAVARFSPAAPTLVLAHNDADGLAAGALFARALPRAGLPARVRVLGRGENPWSAAMADELAGQDPGGLVVTDLGTRAEAVRPGTPTVVVDHHVPAGAGEGPCAVVSGHGMAPVPTSSLLAWWCAGALAPVDDLLWLAALGIIGDGAEKSGFPELAEARRRYGITALRDAVSLVNAPRRSAAGDAGPALALLLRAEGPKEVTSGIHPETAALHAARDEVRRALEEARRVPPRVVGEVALILLHSPCQVHPLVAQSWTGRLRDKVVLAANTGYRPGWVHFAARSATGRDLVAFLRRHRPADADEAYGQGHEQATGGALRPEGWAEFLAGLGFAGASAAA